MQASILEKEKDERYDGSYCNILHQYVYLMINFLRYFFHLQVYNKIDQCSIEEVNRIAHQPDCVVISCEMKLNLDYLLEMVWESLSLICIYTKKRGSRPDFEEGIIMRRGCNVEHVVSFQVILAGIILEEVAGAGLMR